MGKCTLLTLLAVIATTTLSFTIPKKAFFGFPLEDISKGFSDGLELARDARDESDVMSENRTINASDSCDETVDFECWENSHMHHVLNGIFHFHFADLAEELPSYCPLIDSDACAIGECDGNGMLSFINFGFSVVEMACSRKEDFQTHIACWADPFPQELFLCLKMNTTTDDNVAHNLHLGDCFETTVRNLAACTTEAQNFFIEFSGYVLDQS